MNDRRQGPRFVVPVQGGRSAGPGHAVTRRPAQPPTGEALGDRRFRALFDNAPLGVVLSDPDGRFTEANPSLRTLLEGTGLDPDTGSLADLTRHLPEGGEEARTWREALADVRSGRRPVARADLPVAPAGAPPRWLRMTTGLVVIGERRYLLSHVEDVTRQRLEIQRLTHLALHDPLTGLPNRTLLADRLAERPADRPVDGMKDPVALVCLRLDGLADLDATMGRAAGDALVVAVAERLTACCGPLDTVARLGGATFAVLAHEVAGEAIADLAERLRRAAAEPLDVAGTRLLPVVAVRAAPVLTGDTLEVALERAQPVDDVHLDLRETDLRETDLRETDLRETDLRETDLRETDLRETDLRETDLRETGVRETGVRDQDPRGTDQRRA